MEKNIASAEITDMTNNVPEYSVAPVSTDAAAGTKETEWINALARQYLGYYKKIPEIHSAINAYATWIVGKGYTISNIGDKVTIDFISGWGEDSFNSIIWNLIIQKKVYGDAYAEIIRDEKTGEIINIKPLDPAKIKTIVDEVGIIKRYEQMDKVGKEGKTVQKFEPEQLLHLCNDRIADEIHGVSVLEAVEKVILWKNQVMDDMATMLHRNVIPVRILEVDTDDPLKVSEILTKYEKMIKYKEVLVVPKDTIKITTDGGAANAIINPLPFMNYLDDFIYRALNVPKVILGGGQDFTEASSKISIVSYEQFWSREQEELAADLWNQLGIKIKLNKSISIQNDLITDESKDNNSMALTKPGEMTPTTNQE